MKKIHLACIISVGIIGTASAQITTKDFNELVIKVFASDFNQGTADADKAGINKLNNAMNQEINYLTSIINGLKADISKDSVSKANLTTEDKYLRERSDNASQLNFIKNERNITALSDNIEKLRKRIDLYTPWLIFFQDKYTDIQTIAKNIPHWTQDMQKTIRVDADLFANRCDNANKLK